MQDVSGLARPFLGQVDEAQRIAGQRLRSEMVLTAAKGQGFFGRGVRCPEITLEEGQDGMEVQGWRSLVRRMEAVEKGQSLPGPLPGARIPGSQAEARLHGKGHGLGPPAAGVVGVPGAPAGSPLLKTLEQPGPFMELPAQFDVMVKGHGPTAEQLELVVSYGPAPGDVKVFNVTVDQTSKFDSRSDVFMVKAFRFLYLAGAALSLMGVAAQVYLAGMVLMGQDEPLSCG